MNIRAKHLRVRALRQRGGDRTPARATSTCRFEIFDLHCRLCAVVLRQSLAVLPGVVAVSVNEAMGCANVDYERTRLGWEDLRVTIAKAGFNVHDERVRLRPMVASLSPVGSPLA
ncbi:MAG: heavy-metal-associated domain-containing protein [Actinomycetota bacterium]